MIITNCDSTIIDTISFDRLFKIRLGCSKLERTNDIK